MNWDEAITFARTTLNDKLLSDKEIQKIRENSSSVEHFTLIIQLIYQDSKQRPAGVRAIDYFLKIVDKSIYNLKSWIDGIYFFQQWLKKSNRETDFRKMLGYLQCCEESPEIKDTRVLFIDLIEAMLEEHGYIG